MDGKATKRLVSAVELGDLLGVADSTVRKWARAGEIPSRLLPGGRYIFDADEVLDSLRPAAEPARRAS